MNLSLPSVTNISAIEQKGSEYRAAVGKVSFHISSRSNCTFRDSNKTVKSRVNKINIESGAAGECPMFCKLLPIVEGHPAHVAAEWLGHSTLVAQKHYWQVTDDDFERASNLHYPIQSGAELKRTKAHQEDNKQRNPRRFRKSSGIQDELNSLSRTLFGTVLHFKYRVSLSRLG